MAEMDENEGMSTGKKVAAGAALGVAVPAAVAVGKKLLGDDDEGQDTQQRSAGRGSQQRSRSRSSGSGRRSTGSKARSSTSKRSTSKSASRSSSGRSRSSSSRSSGGSRGGTGRTKEQLYNQAKRLKIEGRSSMTKAQLERAVSRARG